MRNQPVKIAPSILSADFSRFGAECVAAEQAGGDWIHVDVMDGHFVPNITFGPALCAAIRPCIKTIMDVHLMISPVDTFIEAFAAAGSDILTVHVEATRHVQGTLQEIRKFGIRPGIALNPATPAKAIEHLLDLVDLVCVMTVNPGFGGQKFIKGQLSKIEEIAAMIGDRAIHLQVDGGIALETAAAAAAAGADVLVAGSAIFGTGAPGEPVSLERNIKQLRNAIQTRAGQLQC